MRAVAITVNNRPHYLKSVMESWRQVRGIEDVRFIFQVEPAADLTQSDLHVTPATITTIIMNGEQKGALGNPYAAMETAFSYDDVDFAILGEEDSTVTADVLEFFDYAATKYRRAQACLAVCSFQQVRGAEPHIIFPRPYFASVVWGTWRDRWEHIRTRWAFNYDPPWDRMMLDLAQKDMYCVFPGVSRSQHIGQFGGTHMQPSEFEAMQAQEVHDGSPTHYLAIGVDA